MCIPKNHLQQLSGQVVWLTGLPCSGKTTIAQELRRQCQEHSISSFILDGDELRSGVNSDLGFDEASRTENVRRVAELAKLMAASEIAVFVALISPRRSMRSMAKEIIGSERFHEIFVSCSAETCAQRDVKGHWRKANTGQMSNFTGVQSGYENPEHANLILKTDELPLEECCRQIAELVTAKATVQA